jgi:hypothetical protein
MGLGHKREERGAIESMARSGVVRMAPIFWWRIERCRDAPIAGRKFKTMS